MIAPSPLTRSMRLVAVVQRGASRSGPLTRQRLGPPPEPSRV